MRVRGVVLAAGAGTRYGHPKALARTDDGTPWVTRVAEALAAGGCDEVGVLLGARAEEALPLVPRRCDVTVVPDWRRGVSATVRRALTAAADSTADALLVVPVDVPGLPASVCRRIVASAIGPAALVRAGFDGMPGHPVLIGRDHWAELAAAVTGDRGAGPLLAARGALVVECGDLWDGADTDLPQPISRR
ncbi:NTP transferase domain-containing protein [Microbacterium sp. ARD31]|uniref:nucleotidyltransferase family protein n=1 Tax=Microbacterium sp. ARD31 TaxID=2962576 RepID=UPI002881FCB3|nr:NTP transferase domain-containing protein [Microbacterium sp. ARD31]MDT0182354.1 NTP transferase domain-containing protein [Microbacterium sp. ARD31]